MQIIGTYNGYYSPQVNFRSLKITPNKSQWKDLRVFSHYLYEYKKGLRNLILTTEKESNREIIKNRLEKENISYLIQKVDKNKINVFFGHSECIKIIETFNQPKLNEYTPEQDFILGTLLGYDKIQQCQRYMKMCAKRHSNQ